MEVISVCCSRESMVLHYFYTVQRVNSEQNQDTFVRTPAGNAKTTGRSEVTCVALLRPMG